MLDEERRCQRRDDGDGDDDRIDIVRNHAEGQAKARYDKGEFTDLRKRAAAVNSILQALPGEQHPHRGEEQLADDGDKGENKDRDDILHDHSGVKHHADRDEEHCAEEILYPLRQMLHALGMYRARKQRACEECAESRGEAEGIGQEHHTEAQAEGDDQQSLIAHKRRSLVEQRRQQVDAENKPEREIQHQHAKLQRKRHTGDTLPDGNGREDYHHEYSRDVLNDQCAEHELGKALLLDAEIIKGLDDDSGGAHGEHAAEEDAVHRAPAERLTDKVAEEQHAADLGQGGYDSRAADAHELMEIELQPEAEHEDYYADLAPCAYGGAVGDVKEEGHVRADQEAREYVAQNERLIQLFENDGDDAAGQKYDSKVGNKFRQMQY